MSLAIIVEIDQDYDPRTAVDWSTEATVEYVAQFVRGELTPYVVTLIDEVECGCGNTHDHYLASLAGCDVETAGADGRYTTIDRVPNEYLRTVARELCDEVGIEHF